MSHRSVDSFEIQDMLGKEENYQSEDGPHGFCETRVRVVGIRILLGRGRHCVRHGPHEYRSDRMCACALQVVFPCIWITHLALRPISRELNGRTRTATFTDAPAMAQLRPQYLRAANHQAESVTNGEKQQLGHKFDKLTLMHGGKL